MTRRLPPPAAYAATSPEMGEDKNGASSPFMGEVAAQRPEGDVRTRARRLRQAMTRHEVKLWFQLKAFNKEYGCHFRRQAPVGRYILDFVDFGRRLIIEVDGWQHGESRGLVHDEKRDTYFRRSGFQTLRFWNHEIDQSLDGVCDAVLAAVRERSAMYPSGRRDRAAVVYPPPARRATSPIKGEDEGR